MIASIQSLDELQVEFSLDRKIAKYAEYMNGNIIIFNIKKLKDDGWKIPDDVKELKISNYCTPNFRGGISFCKLYSIDAFSVLISEMISAQELNKYTTF